MAKSRRRRGARRYGELAQHREPEHRENAGQHFGGAVDPRIACYAVGALVFDDACRLLYSGAESTPWPVEAAMSAARRGPGANRTSTKLYPLPLPAAPDCGSSVAAVTIAP